MSMTPNDGRNASDICKKIRLSSPAKKLLVGDQSPGAFIHQLVEHDCYVDAVRFMGRALHPRDAVWWATLCAWDVGGRDLPLREMKALGSALLWVLEPSEENRKLALISAEQAGLRTPSGCAALAAAMAGSIKSADATLEPTDADAAARSAIAAVFFAASRRKEGKRTQKYANYIVVGWHISQQQRHWEGFETQ